MRNKIYSLVAFMAATLALTGCMKNEELDNKDAYNGTAIVSFTIDKVKVARDTVNSAGKDTTIWVSYKARPIERNNLQSRLIALRNKGECNVSQACNQTP